MGKYQIFALFLFQFDKHRIAQPRKICNSFSGKNLWVFPHRQTQKNQDHEILTEVSTICGVLFM